ncbi:MAG: peroxiredoxin [Gammaproteobacteria bacterium]|jgi:peroxiredoxin Q/BCP|nr:MAG: peroxiredoxin [Gammaproteobacteria bacterium]
MLKKGDLAPTFEGKDQSGNSLSLEALLSNGPVLLYFYPADFTPICTAQACAFRDRQGALTDVSLQIVGVSPQSEGSHQRFADTYDLGFPLIPDQNKQIIKAYGVDGPFGIGVRRATYLIGVDGRIRDRVVSDLFVGSHTDFIKSAIESLEADGTRG